MNILDELKKEEKYCCGCAACENACPTGAVTFRPDKWGFYYPETDPDKCINCGRCTAVCPKLSADRSNAEEPECYAAQATDDIRFMSSSGGMFTVLAEHILSQGGVVAGAAMEDDYSVHHMLVEDCDELYRLRKSKYVQSFTGDIYKQCAAKLKEGKKVLFTGCPCQVAAMKNYAKYNCKNETENLYLVDILCHGVPSVQMLQDYVKENFDGEKLQTIDFRSKLNGWRSDQIRVFWKDGSSDRIEWQNSAYEEGFQRNISLRDGCEDCEFGGHCRQGDLTIGDFWQVERHDPALNDLNGTSVVLINNDKGRDLFDTIRQQLILAESVPIEAARYNRLQTKTTPHPMKERFRHLYPARSFTEAVWQCRHALYDIGLVGNYMVSNYGGALTQFALYSTLENMGYSVLMIDRPKDCKEPPREKLKMFMADVYAPWSRSRIFPNIAEMKFLNQQCRTFVTGSDQLFNNNLYNWYGKIQAQNFVTGNHRQIAYAASFGHDYIWGPDSDRGEEAFYLRRFDYFSVREDSGVDVCRDYFGVEATWVLDPVFLCPRDRYAMLIDRVPKDKIPGEKYLYTYILDPTKQAQTIIEDKAKADGLSIVAVGDNIPPMRRSGPQWTIPLKTGILVEEWLAYIKNADFIITDSFHGICFSIIFHKQFIALVNKIRGESRFTSLLRLLKLEGHIAYTLEQVQALSENYEEIDYEAVDRILDSEISRSKKWLTDAIETDKESDKKRALSAFDILDGRCDDIDRKIDDLQKQINGIYSSKVLAGGRKAGALFRKLHILKPKEEENR